MAAATRAGIGELSPRLLCDSEQGLGNPTRSDLLSSFNTYADLFDDLDNQPEGDVRHRFLRLRALRAPYVERFVRGQERALDDLLAEVQTGKADPADEDCLRRFDNIMLRVDVALHWYSRIYDEDCKAANGDVVDPYLMDNFFRLNLEKPGKGPRAPNGELSTTLYGSTGNPVPRSLIAIRGCNNDIIRRFILDKLTIPFNHHICIPIHKRYNKIMGHDTGLPSQGLSGKTLGLLVGSVECIISVGSIAAAVVLLYSLGSTKQRLIAAPFASLTSTISVIFLSEEAKSIFTLTAGVWAVLIVIVVLSTANFSCKAG